MHFIFTSCSVLLKPQANLFFVCQDKQEVHFISPIPSSTGSPSDLHMQPLGERRSQSTSRYGGAFDSLPFPHALALANHLIKAEHCSWWTPHTSSLPLCNQVLVQSVIVAIKGEGEKKGKSRMYCIKSLSQKHHRSR